MGEGRAKDVGHDLANAGVEAHVTGTVEGLVGDGGGRVRVWPGGGPWFGGTYKQGREVVVRSIRELIDGGAYPEHLRT